MDEKKNSNIRVLMTYRYVFTIQKIKHLNECSFFEIVERVKMVMSHDSCDSKHLKKRKMIQRMLYM